MKKIQQWLKRLREKGNALWASFVKGGASRARQAVGTLSVFCAAGVMAFAVGQISNEVVISIDGSERTVYAVRQSADTILAQQMIQYTQDDEVVCTYNEEGLIERIDVTTAFPVSVTADGETVTVHLLRGTVADAIAAAKVSLGSLDTVNYETDDAVFSGMEIHIDRVEKVVTVTQEAIPYETKYVYSPIFADGKSEVEVSGRNGTREITTTELYVDGVLVSTEVSTRTVKKPTTRKVVVGQASSEAISDFVFEDVSFDANGIPTEYSDLISGIATAYGANDGSQTASGVKPGVGYIAVNPKLIPYGTRLYIRSIDGSVIYGFAIAADCGPSVLKNITVADLFMPTEAEIWEWGRREIEIYILD